MRDDKIYCVWNAEGSDLGIGKKTGGFRIINLPERKIVDWQSITYTLQDGRFTDYQDNTDGLRMCSGRLKSLIEANKSENDVLQWLEVSVSDERQARPYYVLHFPEIDDVLDKNGCVYDEAGDVIKPVLSRAICAPYNLIAFKGDTRFSTMLYVRDNVRKAILKAGCTGMVFDKENLAECDRVYLRG